VTGNQRVSDPNTADALLLDGPKRCVEIREDPGARDTDDAGRVKEGEHFVVHLAGDTPEVDLAALVGEMLDGFFREGGEEEGVYVVAEFSGE